MDPITTQLNAVISQLTSIEFHIQPAWLCLAFYLLAVRILRHYRLSRLEKRYAAFVKNPYSMSYRAAHEIAKLHMFDEHPFLLFFSTQWALIKTYGMVGGTGLLVKTRQLTAPECIGRRAEDTGVLLMELLAGDMDSPRWMEALAKVNWQHSRYKKQITNDDMIHTMAVFILEPIKYIDRWGWRPLTKMEKVSRFIFWKEIGKRMGIEGIPNTLEELESLTEEIEQREMIFSPNNKLLADATMDMMLRGTWFPNAMNTIVRSFFEERVLQALGWEPAPKWVELAVDWGFRIRAWMIRNLFLPRWKPFELPKEDKDGRIYRSQFVFEPWYISQTIWSKMYTYLSTGGRLSAGGKFGSTGYLPVEVGPHKMSTSSKKEVLAQAAAMEQFAKEARPAHCPFTFNGELVWSNEAPPHP